MKIGIITGEYPPMLGGVGAYTDVLAHSLTAQGHDIHLFSTSSANSTDLPITKSVSHWNLSSLFAARRWAAQFDIVNLQFQTAAYGMSPFIHFLPDVVGKIPVVTTFHDLRHPYLFPKAGPLRDWIVMRLARASNGVIVTNHEDLQRIQHLPNVRLIPIGSNILTELPEDFDAAVWREKIGAQPGDFLIAHFGFVKLGKGLETLLESVVQLRRENFPARLLMIGGRTSTNEPTDAAYTAAIDQHITDLGISDYVYWTGYVDEREVGAYLTASDAVVLPFADGVSYRSGSLMAALRYDGVIITTTPRTAIPTFRDGENMLLFPPNDSAALTRQVRRLYDTPPLRVRLQEGARQLARQFDWTQIAQDYVEFFQHIIG